MPPKARSNALRGRGRPKRAATPEPAPVATSTPAKRGRPAKADASEAVAEPPKKRGRPAKAKAEEPAAVVEDAPKRGRRSLVAPEPVEEAPVPKKRAGRRQKEGSRVEEVSDPKKRGGHPRKEANALHLNRVAGSPRVAKRSSPRSKTTATHSAPRINPRMRSRLRTRLAPAQKAKKEEPVRQPAKRGRPLKATAEGPTPKKATGRKAAKPAKPVAPRKRRGYTMLEIPDKFLVQMQQSLQGLLDGDYSDVAPIEEDAADDVDMVEDEDLLITSPTAGGDGQEQGILSSEQDQDQEQEEPSDDAALGVDVEGEDIQEDDNDQEEDVQAMVVQDDMYQDGLPEEAEPAQAIEMELNMQEVVQVEQNADDSDMSFAQEIDENFAVHDDDPEEPQSLLEDHGDSFVRGPSRPSAATVFA